MKNTYELLNDPMNVSKTIHGGMIPPTIQFHRLNFLSPLNYRQLIVESSSVVRCLSNDDALVYDEWNIAQILKFNKKANFVLNKKVNFCQFVKNPPQMEILVTRERIPQFVLLITKFSSNVEIFVTLSRKLVSWCLSESEDMANLGIKWLFLIPTNDLSMNIHDTE